MALISKRTQILTDETENCYGFIVNNDGVDFSQYLRNPVLTREHFDEDQVLGKVVNIKYDASLNAWTGNLEFADTDLGREYYELYESGFYNAVSIKGRANMMYMNGNIPDRATSFKVNAIGLCSVPANDNALVVGLSANGSYSKDKVQDFTIKHVNNMETKEDKVIDTTLENKEEKDVALSAPKSDGEEKKETKPEPKSTLEEKQLSFGEKVIGMVNNIIGLNGSTVIKPQPEKTEIVDTQLSAKKEEPAQVTEKTEDKALNVSGNANTIDISNMKTNTGGVSVKTKYKNLHEAMVDGYVEHALSNTSRTAYDLKKDPNSVALNASKAESSSLLAEAVMIALNDTDFMQTMKDVTFKYDDGGVPQMHTAHQVMQQLSFGQNSYNFLQNTPDLARFAFLTNYYYQLYTSEEWTRGAARWNVPGQTGVIWANGAADPRIFFGTSSPRNLTQSYNYDDIAVAMPLFAFSIESMVWYPIDDVRLAYDKRGTGMQEAMNKLRFREHNYYFQKFAELAKDKVPLTGEVFSATNSFNANTGATGNIHGPSSDDVRWLQNRLARQNWNDDILRTQLVLDSTLYTTLQGDPDIKSRLTHMNPEGQTVREFNYANTHIMQRSYTPLYDNATNAVIDSQQYADVVLDANNNIPASPTPPVIPTTAYGIGLGFIPNQIIIGIGNTEVFQVVDPEAYGYKFSLTTTTGAACAYKDGKGAVVLYPADE